MTSITKPARLILVFVLVISLFLGATTTILAANPVYVDANNPSCPGDGSQGDPYCTIQLGVDNVDSGGTVYVAAGTYNESVTIPSSKPLSLIGAGCGQSFINANGNGIVILADNVTIMGFSISGSGDGIILDGVQDCSILDNCIYDNGSFGIYGDDAHSNLIKGNNIDGNGTGIHLDYSDDNEIYCNDIHSNDEYGIWLYDACGNVIHYNNIFSNGTYGVYNEDNECSVDATYNYWGCSDGPGGSGCDEIGTYEAEEVYYDPYSANRYTDCPDEEPGSSPRPSPTPTPTPSTPTQTVGGDIFSVNKTGLIAPWIVLAVIIVAGGLFLYRRRVHSMK